MAPMVPAASRSSPERMRSRSSRTGGAPGAASSFAFGRDPSMANAACAIRGRSIRMSPITRVSENSVWSTGVTTIESIETVAGRPTETP